MLESLKQWKRLRCGLNLQYTVEPGITDNVNIGDAHRLEQGLRLTVLHEQAGETLQYAAIPASIPLEEHLLRSENARHAICRYVTVFQYVQVVVPELILDEECHDRFYCTQERNGVAPSVDGQVADDVRSLIVLAHLISRWREKGEQDFVFRMFLAYSFHKRPTLLELSERRRMEPDILGIVVNLVGESGQSPSLALPHGLDLLAEQTCNEDTKFVSMYNQIVHILVYFSISMALRMRASVSSLPRKAEISNMPGPLPSPTSVRRKAFMMSPSL